MDPRWFVLTLLLGVALAACDGSGGIALPPPLPPPAPPPPSAIAQDVIALHDQDLPNAGLSCQAAECHPDQMERYAPHKDAQGKSVENFHYFKARMLKGIYFEGRAPDNLNDHDCTLCHKRVSILASSGATATGAKHLRRLVDVAFCAGCHTPSNPVAPALYLD